MSPRRPFPRLQSTLGGSTVLGLALSVPIRKQLSRTLPAEVALHMVECIEEIIALRRTSAAPMLVFELCDPTQVRAPAWIFPSLIEETSRGVLRALPSVAIYRTTQVVSLSALRDFEHVQVVAIHSPRGLEALWRALERALASSIGAALLAAIGDLPLPLVRQIMAVALSRADRAVYVPEIAAAVHMHERSLRRRLRAEIGEMSAQELIGWARILRVAWSLTQPERAITDIANTHSFSAASNLHRQVRRYTGRSVRALQAGDPVATAARCFRDALQDRLTHAGRISDWSP